MDRHILEIAAGRNLRHHLAIPRDFDERSLIPDHEEGAPDRREDDTRGLADRADLTLTTPDTTIKAIVEQDLRDAKIKPTVTGRPKHYYSVYQKMIVRGRDFADIYDLVGVRVLVESVRDCYAVLGALHARWNPVPGRFKDYIAMPKFNMYQSLHTTVIGPEGRQVEIQIRTHQMHRRAEYGVAAHWKYKDDPNRTGRDGDSSANDMVWLRQLLEWQRETSDPGEFLDSLRFEINAQEVYVFTPKGDVVALPSGSTPVDFAYAVHTEVGHRCIGARVNQRLVPLEDGEVVLAEAVAGIGSDRARVEGSLAPALRDLLEVGQRVRIGGAGQVLDELPVAVARRLIEPLVVVAVEELDLQPPVEHLADVAGGDVVHLLHPGVGGVVDVARAELAERDVHDVGAERRPRPPGEAGKACAEISALNQPFRQRLSPIHSPYPLPPNSFTDLYRFLPNYRFLPLFTAPPSPHPLSLTAIHSNFLPTGMAHLHKLCDPGGGVRWFVSPGGRRAPPGTGLGLGGVLC